jgi:hypothetical protein
MPAELIAGINVLDFTSQQRSQQPRLQLSSGTTKIAQDDLRYSEYNPNAIVPQGPWREPTSQEKAILFSSDPPTQQGSWISVIEVPPHWMTPFEDLRQASENKDINSVRKMTSVPSCISAIADVANSVRELIAIPDTEVEWNNIAVTESGLITSTYDNVSQQYIGLHLDSWYKRPLEERYLSPNRICINVGLDDRYLLFINQSLVEMASLLVSSHLDLTPKDLIVSQLGKTFTNAFPHYPVIKLKISPGEAYIAPTENIIHDGSTLGKHFFDLSLTVRGNIGPQLKADINQL